jgi:NitT/TauT family transport system ATP-binding protein
VSTRRDDAPAQIAVRALGQVFEADAAGEITALQKIDLQVAAGEFVCLLGPSGCGKSTLLNAIAGFLVPSTGEILIEGRAISGPGPDRGMVFQEYALFPWMTVADNVGFGLAIKRLPRAEIAARVDQLLARFGLLQFRDRFPKDLSGGMRQRVAIARVLALDPPILLMDEPFAALDALTRQTLQDDLLRLWAELGKTVIFVTHSIDEALYLADRVVVMTYRPGTIKRDERVDLPRPRDPTTPAFNDRKRELAALVQQEHARFIEGERAIAAGTGTTSLPKA